jgi:hypothetical protein
MITQTMGRIVQMFPPIALAVEDPIYLATDEVGITKICFSYARALHHAGWNGTMKFITKEQLEAMLFEKIDLKLVH